jgi:DNA-binding HxlR family transcriptional regulator
MMQCVALRSLHIESHMMPRIRFNGPQCPIALSLECVGEWWTILIMRDAFQGVTRFDQFQNSLGIAPNILSRRLSSLVEAGLLRRSRYNERPPRDEYVLTERGRDFRPVLWALLAWGNKHFMPAGQSVVLVDSVTGQPVDPATIAWDTQAAIYPERRSTEVRSQP